MDNIKVIHVENFDINKKFVISVDCKINYKLYSIEVLQQLFKTQVSDVIDKNSLKSDELIILVNYDDINPKNISMKKIKSIINLMCNEFPYILHKCIFYNINASFTAFIKLIKIFLDRETAKKIITKKEVSLEISKLKLDSLQDIS
tara:strand:+ start:92 stop:529 length:438 start_codon:yes stop_codon:yes gene_type:complete